jgi:hypothetical protein
MKQTKPRIIYLDIHGVLYTGDGRSISERILKNLKVLVQESGGLIVISSSYRRGNWEALRDWLIQQGVPSIIGCTSRTIEDKARSIREDVSERGDIEFVVIDDNELDTPHLIKCDPVRGLTKSVAMKALAEFASQGSFEGQEQ